MGLRHGIRLYFLFSRIFLHDLGFCKRLVGSPLEKLSACRVVTDLKKNDFGLAVDAVYLENDKCQSPKTTWGNILAL